MKRTFVIGGVATALLVGVAAFAASGGQRGDGASHRAERLDHIFEMFDANADGAIELAEVEASHTARFAAADANGDGSLTADELSNAAAKRAERRIAGMLKRLDANGDGAIDAAEFAAKRGEGKHHGRHGAKMFKRFDTDGDGRVTRAEAEAHMEKRHKRWHDDG
ncbi:MAG: EF-hand domain-containing protein [Pikeienuella sp.]